MFKELKELIPHGDGVTAEAGKSVRDQDKRGLGNHFQESGLCP